MFTPTRNNNYLHVYYNINFISIIYMSRSKNNKNWRKSDKVGKGGKQRGGGGGQNIEWGKSEF